MNELLTVAEVAPLLKLEPHAIYRLVREGYIPHLKIGERKIRFSATALQKWADAQLATTAQQVVEASAPAQ